MQIMTTERLKLKYCEQALKMIQSDRSDATKMGFKTENWHDVASGKAECLIESVIDLIRSDINEMEEEAKAREDEYNAPKGQYMGIADDYKIENGEYVYEEQKDDKKRKLYLR